MFFGCAVLFLSYSPSSCQKKAVTKIHNPGKLHQYNIYGCEVVNFQMFLYWCSFHEMALFVQFVGSSTQEYSWIMLKLPQELVLRIIKTQDHV